jgi:hypothetical protein
VRRLVRVGAPGALAVVRLRKTFVAAVVLQLVAEGKLGLDDPVERWLPGLVPNGRRMNAAGRALVAGFIASPGLSSRKTLRLAGSFRGFIAGAGFEPATSGL